MPDPGMPAGRDGGPGLVAFQAEVAQLFFGLPKSKGFLLAGGAALLAQHLTARPTEDLDFFTAPGRGHVPAARDALEEATRKPLLVAEALERERWASGRRSLLAQTSRDRHTPRKRPLIPQLTTFQQFR
jgi:Nucleotidyl transferase AbiEii toxin, Type IV TA system